MQQLIVDKDGELFRSTALYPAIDPMTGTRFEPELQVRIKPNSWIASQPAIVKEVEEVEVKPKAKPAEVKPLEAVTSK